MTSLGETLRRERLRRNLDLDRVSRELKISPRFLEAIEDEEFARLPGGVFAKSFVRQYARFLDLDEEEAANQVQRTIAPAAAPELSEIAAQQRGTSSISAFLPRVDSISGRRFGSGSWLSALALVVAVMLGCSLFYGWWQRERHPVQAASLTRSATAVPQAAQSAAPPANVAQNAPATDAPVAIPAAELPRAVAPPTSNPLNTTEGTAAAPAAMKPAGALQVTITTSDQPVWVLARADGKYAFSATLEPNQTRTVDADGIVLLRIGNAGGVALSVNGKPIPEVGPKGQVRTVQLTSGGFQIVAPPKPSAVPDGL